MDDVYAECAGEAPAARRDSDEETSLPAVPPAVAEEDSHEANPEPLQDGTRLRVHGRDASAKFASRINGIYTRQTDAHNGHSVWCLVQGQPRQASSYIFQCGEEKWRISINTGTKGDFAHANDAAPFPWEVSSVWKVFNGEIYQDDTNLKVEVIGRHGRR